MTEYVLDESILDIDSWLPQEAVDEVVALILESDNDQFFQSRTWFSQVVKAPMRLSVDKGALNDANLRLMVRNGRIEWIGLPSK